MNSSKLFQNNPNPFNDNTEISYFLSENISSASIIIYNMNGVQINQYLLSTTGSGKIIINSSELVPGMYIYALIADKVEIDTKRMILTDN